MTTNLLFLGELSIEGHVLFCSGFRYAGLEYGAECHCGNRVCAQRARAEDCNLDCRGEKGSLCGGVGRMSVYRVEDRLPGQKRCESH